MKHVQDTKVNPAIADQHNKAIDICNDFVDELKGTVIAVKTISAGQPRPYADAVYESQIFCFQPNVFTTNGPCARLIDEVQARQLARIFVRDWGEHEKPYLGGYLSFVRPEKDPAGFSDSYKPQPGDTVRSSCWRVRVVLPYTG